MPVCMRPSPLDASSPEIVVDFAVHQTYCTGDNPGLTRLLFSSCEPKFRTINEAVMNFVHAHGLRHFVIIAAASMGLMLTAVSAASAFTLEGPAEGNSDYRGFTDLQLPGNAPSAPSDSRSPLSESNDKLIESGNTTVQFGAPQSFGQRYNPSNLLDPFAREGR